ncbi:hypothetical protein KCV87_23905 [Actinosynnema pretiosum subsp. pretiosum]|uniref:Uncharacterized protein n=1 Tax=Actinosynnema pretiosum subsp. pretiosum TaxID=103721 RepID=A0AA45L2X4_9PSEU|nr:hypothetical protein APASM_6361 [Actinosynnema pretiosum subsp. pretiosum]QUF02499.1 hypothetical protein KCV87_23905 [Actinosynnema pretiosum subsp. pretiosum]
MTTTELGFDEDEGGLMLGAGWQDDEGVQRVLLLQRGTDEDLEDEHEISLGLDTYCVSAKGGFTAYGCLSRVALTEDALTLEFRPEGAEALHVPATAVVPLAGTGVDRATLSGWLRVVLAWGRPEKRPELVGLTAPGGAPDA